MPTSTVWFEIHLQLVFSPFYVLEWDFLVKRTKKVEPKQGNSYQTNKGRKITFTGTLVQLKVTFSLKISYGQTNTP